MIWEAPCFYFLASTFRIAALKKDIEFYRTIPNLVAEHIFCKWSIYSSGLGISCLKPWVPVTSPDSMELNGPTIRFIISQIIMSYLFPLEATQDSLVSCKTLPTELMATSKCYPTKIFHFQSWRLFGVSTVQEPEVAGGQQHLEN